LSEKQLQVWFTHRRRKDRRDGIDVDQLMPHGNNHCNSERQGDDDDEPELLQEMQVHLNNREEDGSCLKDRYPISVVEDDDDDDDDVIILESINGMDRSNAKFEKIQKPKPAIARKEIAPQLKHAGEKQLPCWRPNLELEVNIANNAEAAHELAAIAAVEMQLRGPMQDDGPPLGFEFDSLPPDAFQEFTGRQGKWRFFFPATDYLLVLLHLQINEDLFVSVMHSWHMLQDYDSHTMTCRGVV
jgi:hypothetical protein